MMPTNPRVRWEPVLMPGAVTEHWALCRDCPHSLEWSPGAPDDLWVSDGPPHFVLGKVMPSEALGLGGVFSVGLTNDDGDILYNSWVPEATAVRFRDLMLKWWPLDRYPKGDV